MNSVAQSPPSGFGSSESVLNILKLILAGSELPKVLQSIARLVEPRGSGTFCTIWLPNADGTSLDCAAAPNLPEFAADILREPAWDDYRHPVLPYGIRAVWARPLFTREGKLLGAFAILYREVRRPGPADLELIEKAGQMASIAIERHLSEEILRRERDRLRLLFEITNSTTSKLDFPRLVEALSTNLLGVTRCDFCALLLPDADSGELRLTVLYNPEARGSLCDGTVVPIRGSLCGKAFRSGKTQHYHRLEELRDDPESFGSSADEQCHQRIVAEGLVSGCDLPLIGRNGVVGVLAALKRSGRAFETEEVMFLEQAARQVAIAVENALEYEKSNRRGKRRVKGLLADGIDGSADRFERPDSGRDGNRQGTAARLAGAGIRAARQHADAQGGCEADRGDASRPGGHGEAVHVSRRSVLSAEKCFRLAFPLFL